MWMRAKENYYSKRTGKQLLIEGKQYEVIIRNPRKNEYLLIDLDESHFLISWEKQNVHVIMKGNKVVKICNSWENK